MLPALLRGSLWLAALAAGWALLAPTHAGVLVCVAVLAGASAWLLWRSGLAQSAPFRRSDVGMPAPLALGSDALNDIAIRLQDRIAEAASFDAALHDAAHLLKTELGARDARTYRVDHHGDDANDADLRITELLTLTGGFQVPCPAPGGPRGALGDAIRNGREVLALPESLIVPVVRRGAVVAVLELTGIEITIDAEPLRRTLAATGRALAHAAERGVRDAGVTPSTSPAMRREVRSANESQFHELGFDGSRHQPLRSELMLTMLNRNPRPPIPAPGSPAQGRAGASAVGGTASTGTASTITVLDSGALARLAELDPTGGTRLLPRVLTAYLNSVARLRPQLLEARPRLDLIAIRHVAHTLKSSSASIGAIKFAALCAEIDTMIRIGETTDLNPSLDLMDAELQNVLQAVKQLLDGHS